MRDLVGLDLIESDLALRHTLLQGRVLRSGDPAGLTQEMWALLAVYQALRTAVTDAVATMPAPTPTGPATNSPCTPRRTCSPPPETSSPASPIWPATSAAPY